MEKIVLRSILLSLILTGSAIGQSKPPIAPARPKTSPAPLSASQAVKQPSSTKTPRYQWRLANVQTPQQVDFTLRFQ